MYNYSPFAVPIGSFQTPVVPPVDPPTAGPFFYIPVNCAWMPFVAGSLQQLLLQTTWDTDPDTLIKVQGWIFDMIAQFNCASALTIEQLCGSFPTSGEDCMGCCLKYENGILMQLDCGQWRPVDGQGQGGVGPTTQPAAGSPQPAPGGGCADYAGLIVGSNEWMIPTSLSTGDTIQLVSADGATSDDNINWRCKDGAQYLLGDCYPLYGKDPSSLLPADFLGSVLLHIGSDYYDLGGAGTIVLGGSYSNQPATLTVNYPATNKVNGQLGIRVTVCNNQQPGPWIELFDFATLPGPFTPCGNGMYDPGVGFIDTMVQSGPNNYRGVNLCLNTQTAFSPTRITVQTDATFGVNPQNVTLLLQPGNILIYNVANQSGAYSFDSGPLTNTGITSFEFDDSVGQATAPTDPGGTLTIQGVVIHGTGANPFAL